MKRNLFTRRLAPVLLAAPLAVGAGVFPSHLTPNTQAASTIVVRTNADAVNNSACKPETLRCAINQANADGSGDTIDFSIPTTLCPSQVCTIQLIVPLPGLTATSTSIDGYSQPGAHKNTASTLASPDNAKIWVNINSPSQTGGIGDGLDIYGSNDNVDGLSITNFKANSDGYGGDGIAIAGGASTTSKDHIWGNFLGVLPNGTKGAANQNGLAVQSGGLGATIGGSSAAAANIISGNAFSGIELSYSNTNIVENNLVGTTRTGAAAIPNGYGILALTEGQPKNQKLADVIGPGNVVSGNGLYGVLVAPASGVVGSYEEVLRGNLIGTNSAGNAALPNGGGGVALDQSSGIRVGVVGGGNVISGNGGDGVTIFGPVGGNSVLSNWIGVGRAGQSIPNKGDGVYVENASSLDQIGGAGSATGANQIAHNTRFGVHVGDAAADNVHVSINRNSFFKNTLGGIDLSGQAQLFCTYGSAYIPNTTPNDLTPCPLVLAATPQSVTGEACTGCTVEVYLAPNASDAEGKTWLGTVKAGSCASPPCTNFTVWNLPASAYSQALTPGEHIVATATTPTGPLETSSFTRDVPVGQTLIVTTTADPSTCPSTPDSESPLSLRCAITQANQDVAGDRIQFDIPSTTDTGCANQTIGGASKPVCTIAPVKPLPALTAWSTYIDGYSQPSAAPDSHATFVADNAVITVSVNGSGLTSGDGLDLESSYDAVEGLSLIKFPNDGVFIGNSNNIFDVVAGNFLGLTPRGAGAGNKTNGTTVNTGAKFATIGGRALVDPNVIDYNAGYGIKTSGGGGNILRENIIGMRPTITTGAPNGFDGVLLYGTTLDEVGGFRNGEGNIIGHNFNDGIDGLDAKLASINGNIIPANGFDGIFMYLGSNNLVGGLINTYGPNFILDNAADGVDALADSGDTITYNGVNSNAGVGVMVGNSSSWTEAQRSHARQLLREAGGRPASNLRRDVVVGGESPVYATVGANAISQNGGYGLLVGQSSSDSDVHVWAPVNSLSSNGGGIDLYGSEQCLANSQSGPNDSIACPYVNPSTPSTVQGFACDGCTVEIFQATPDSADASYGEGSTYLGWVVAASDGSWTFNVPSGADLSVGDYVTATATQDVPGTGTGSIPVQYETSEFAYDRQITSAGAPPPHRESIGKTTIVAAGHTSAGSWTALRYPSWLFRDAPNMHIRYRIR